MLARANRATLNGFLLTADALQLTPPQLSQWIAGGSLGARDRAELAYLGPAQGASFAA